MTIINQNHNLDSEFSILPKQRMSMQGKERIRRVLVDAELHEDNAVSMGAKPRADDSTESSPNKLWRKRDRRVGAWISPTLTGLVGLGTAAGLLFSIHGAHIKSTPLQTTAANAHAITDSKLASNDRLYGLTHPYELQSRSDSLIHVSLNLYGDFELQIGSMDYQGRGLRRITVKMIPGKVYHFNPPNGLGGLMIPGSKPNPKIKKVVVDLTWSWQGDNKVNHGQAVFVGPKAASAP